MYYFILKYTYDFGQNICLYTSIPTVICILQRLKYSKAVR